VLVSVTPFGQTGPYAGWRAGELGLWALSGALPTSGYPDRAPSAPPAIGSVLVGTIGALAALTAVRARGANGGGQHVDVSGHETLVATTGVMLPQIDDLLPRLRAGAHGFGLAPWG